VRRIRAELADVSAGELADVFWKCQGERSATFRRFDAGLDELLAEGNTEGYPALVAEMTAVFSVLSATVNAVGEELKVRGNAVAADLVRRLQAQEKENLTVTAALHLDRMRQFKLGGGGSGGGSPEEDEDEAPAGAPPEVASKLRLIASSLRSCRQRRAALIAAINETLEELRYELMEE